MDLELYDDPSAFLAAAGDHLAADPVVATVPASIAQRCVEDPALIRPRYWWAVVRDAGSVVGVAMSTAPSEPHPAYVLPMPREAALLVARASYERGEVLGGVNGSLPAARTCADEVARLTGGTVRVAHHTRLWELVAPVAPAPVAGRLSQVTEDDLELATRWLAAFLRDADEQAGRSPDEPPVDLLEPADLLRRVRSGRLFFWVDADGRPVHLTGANPPSFGVARVGPVYTPPEQRGRGWASATVHAVSAGLLEQGARVCLFTDLANPVSNAIYARLGFEALLDMANLLVLAPHSSG